MRHQTRVKLTVAIAVLVIVGAGLWLSFFGSSIATPGLAATLSNPANQLPAVGPKDAVLIVAPHPDDECIATSGLIQQAIATGARVHVLYLTYGDNHELAYWAMKKIPALTPAQYRSLGETRHAEGIRGAQAMGLKPDDLTFLGYPDSGTLRIWETTWQPGTSRFHAATGTRVVPYSDALSPGSPYNAAAILTDFKSVLLSFSPTIIVLPSPLDLNPDHQAGYLYATAALSDLGMNPVRYTYIVHSGHFPEPRLYNPLAVLTPPSFVASLPLQLRNLQLSSGQVTLKHAATMLYRSQTEVSYRLLASFCRRNEVFLTDEHLPLSSVATPFLLIPTDFLLGKPERKELWSVAASRPSRTTLHFVLTFPEALAEDTLTEISIFPVPMGTPFANEPKLVIKLRHGKQPTVVDYATGASAVNSVTAVEKGSEISLDISMAEAAQDSLIMLQARAGYGAISLYATPWQVFRLP